MSAPTRILNGRTWLLAVLLCALAAGCHSGSSGGSSGLAVSSVTPAVGASGVAMGTTEVTATFNMPVAPITGGASFTVTCAAPCVNPTGSVALDSTKEIAGFTLTPSTTLDASTVYTGTVTGVESLDSGLLLASPFVWTFTTGALPDLVRPQVTLTEPATTNPGPTLGVPIDTLIEAVFSEEMLGGTFGAASFTVTCAAPCTSPGGIVGYDSGTDTAEFALTGLLEPATTYTATVTAAVTDLAGNALGGNQAAPPAASAYVWRFTTESPPAVTAVAPADGASGVAIDNSIVSAEFDQAMAALTGGASFTLTCAAPCVNPTGSVALDGTSRVATFTLTPSTTLASFTVYTATITGAESLATGIAMSAPHVWTFTTGSARDSSRPHVTLTEPVTTIPGPTLGVPRNTAVTAVFSEDMNPGSLGAASFTLTCVSPCVSPGSSATVSYSVGSRTAQFVPTAPLSNATTYTATITIAATDLAGNALAGNQGTLPAASSYVWTFTTAAATLPASVSVLSTSPDADAIAVCPSASVSASFDVPSGRRMDPQTVNSATFIVTGPGPAFAPVVAASVVLDSATGRVATFRPQSDLINGTTYTATVVGGSVGVKDLAVPGNAMATDATWSFTVGPPTANCVGPADLSSVAPFGTFGGSAGMTNTGINTVINGDIGTIATVTSAITGFHDTPGDIYTQTPLNIGTVNGRIYTCANSTTGPTSAPPPNPVSCNIATEARLDAQDAYGALAGLPPGANPGANLASLTLGPGVYTAPAGSFMIQGANLTLDAQGDANAVFVFQMATTLTVGGPGAAAPQSVILAGGAQAKNIFWQVGSAATINAGGGGTMDGTIIAQAGVTFSTAGNVAIVTLNGRALSLGASVTMVNTVINVPAP